MIKTKLLEILKDEYVEGQRYQIITALAGTFAKLNLSKDLLYEIYDELSVNDDEDRTHIIERAYERVSEGLPVSTIYSLPEDLKYKLLLIFKKKDNLDIHKSEKQNLLSLKSKLNKFHLKTEEETIDLSLFSTPIDKNIHKQVYSYLHKRKITDDNIKEFQIRAGILSYINHIIFPVFNKENKCIYYVARNILPEGSRYKNCNKSRESIIWNYYNALKQSKTVVVCEGIINAISVYNYLNKRIPTIATLGKNLTKTQIYMIMRFENIIFNFDGDVPYEYIYDLLSKYFKYKNVEYVKMPEDKDANDLDKKEYLKLFFNRKNITKKLKIRR